MPDDRYVERLYGNLMDGCAFIAMKNENENAPLGDWVKENVVVQSCNCRCSPTCWVAKRLRTMSYEVLHCAAQFGVTLNVRLDATF